MDDFVDWLIERMEERGLSQSQLARASGLSKQTISDYVNRKRTQPDERALQSLARGLHLPTEAVYRAAGILPPEHERAELSEEFAYLLDQLDERDIEEVKRIIKLKIELREQEQKAGQSKPKPEGNEPPSRPASKLLPSHNQ